MNDIKLLRDADLLEIKDAYYESLKILYYGSFNIDAFNYAIDPFFKEENKNLNLLLLC